MRILHLRLRKKPFDMINEGIKLEEYRELKEYWAKRFLSHHTHLNPFFIVRFCHGYATDAPTVCFMIKSISIGNIRPEWGDGMTGKAFVIKLGDRVDNEFVEELMYMQKVSTR